MIDVICMSWLKIFGMVMVFLGSLLAIGLAVYLGVCLVLMIKDGLFTAYDLDK